ncbi:methylmalonyl-CoA mutase family protein, partial [Cecembia sp.]|uniref:methylmalonyl-CoA mutase family protein n=1 Tax=Cecembia sp. TaxID=1898110 RepID=UPI0025BE2256
MQNGFFQDFDPISKAQWIAQAIKDLKGRDFHQTLVTKTLDGIEISPFYTLEDGLASKIMKPYQNKINAVPEIPGSPPRLWSNVFCPYESESKEGNKLILEALMNGSDAILLHVSENTNYEELLKDVALPYIQLFLKPVLGSTPVKVADQFISWLEKTDWGKQQVSGALMWDGMAHLLQERADLKKQVNLVAELMDKLEEYPNFLTMSLDFSVYQEAGASIIQELKYGFASYIELLDQLTERGVEAAKVFNNTLLLLSIGSRYFEEISKIRIASVFFEALAKGYNITLKAEQINVFCQTSTWTKSKLDVHTNMLRNTTEGMSAILGGCNALWVRPHDEVSGISTVFSQRMARNVSNIIKEESYFDKVLDPVAGSYFIENLSESMLVKLKTELAAFESQGGWWINYSENKLQDSVKNTRTKRQSEVLDGYVVKVGANKYREEKVVLSIGETPSVQEAE